MSARGLGNPLAWLLLAFVFAVSVLCVLWLVSIWRHRLGPQGRALRGRMDRLLGPTDASTGEDRLLKASADREMDFVQKLPGMERLSHWLERTQSSQTATAFLGMVAVLFAATFLAVGVLLQTSWQAALGAALVVAALPWLVHLQRDHRQRRRFDELFPDALDYLARALRSGQGLSAGLALVGQEFADPIGREFKKTVDEINYGLSFSDAMGNMARRVRSADMDFFVVGIVLQRETGGNLAELLEGLSATVRERIKLAGKVRVISSEGRLSGIVLGVLPFILAGLLTVLNPEYMNTLWKTEAGMKMVGASLVMMALGGLWIWKIVRVRV